MPRKNSRRSIRPSIALVPPKNNVTPLTVTSELVEPSSISRKRKPSRQPNWITISVFYVLRVAICGAGLAAIAGTALTLFAPTRFLSSQASTPKKQEKLIEPKVATVSIHPGNAITGSVSNLTLGQNTNSSTQTQTYLTEELIPLKQKLMALDKNQEKIETKAFLVDLDNGKYVNLAGDTPISAASLIKIPIAVAFFQDVDAGKIKLNEKLPITKDAIASGSGDMQYQQGQKAFSALETVTKMITISDNTATNMILKRMGGKMILDQRFQEWGLNHTQIHNLLPDLKGTNTTSPHDLATVLLKVNQGELISLKSRDRLLGIMQQTKTRTLLPPGLEPGAIISHKTGDIGTVLGDAGIIDMPSGKRYIEVIIAKRPYNDVAARILIQEMSRTTYQHLKATEFATKSPILKAKAETAQSSIPKVIKTSEIKKAASNSSDTPSVVKRRD